MWWIFAFLSALFAAATAILSKKGVTGVNSNLATGIRTVVVLVLIWLIVLVRGEFKGFSVLTRQTMLYLVLSAVATGLSWICYMRALQLGEASRVAGVDKLSLVLTLVFASFFLGESVSLKTGIGACLIIVGTVLMVIK